MRLSAIIGPRSQGSASSSTSDWWLSASRSANVAPTETEPETREPEPETREPERSSVSAVAERLAVLGAQQSSTLQQLLNLRKLDTLMDLNGCPSGLEELSCDGCWLIQSLAPLSACANLRKLNLFNTNVSSLKPLMGCVKLVGLEQHLHLGVLACCAAASVRASASLPSKLNQVIQPLMQGLRKEPNEMLQEVFGMALAQLMVACISRTPCPNDKLVRNLCTMAWSDPAETPDPGTEDAALAKDTAGGSGGAGMKRAGSQAASAAVSAAVAAAVVNYLRDASDSTFVWLDIFAVNQHHDTNLAQNQADVAAFKLVLEMCEAGTIVVVVFS